MYSNSSVCIEHLFGLTVLAAYLSGLLGPIINIASPVLMCFFVGTSISTIIHALLFLYKSRKNDNTNKLLHLLEMKDTPYIWPLEYKLYMTIMVMGVMALFAIRSF